jgi:hypothetical protein
MSVTWFTIEAQRTQRNARKRQPEVFVVAPSISVPSVPLW